MARLLNGSDLAGFIKERQVHAVRALIQQMHVKPKLAIVQTNDDPVIDTYIRLKRAYGRDVFVDVDAYSIEQMQAERAIKGLNADPSVHGIIVQLPLKDPKQTEKLVNMVAAQKDVDALSDNAEYDPATPMAIMWLLAGYNIQLGGKHIVLVGRGRLVGAPLELMLKVSGYDVEVVDSATPNAAEVIGYGDVVITATGRPGLITSDMLKKGAIVIDAGVASEGGKTKGDLADDVYERDDLMLTPKKGGVGPLTVCALFDNVIRAARKPPRG